MITFFKQLWKRLKISFNYNKVRTIEDIFDSNFFNDINYPLIVNMNIVIIYRDALKKFYGVTFRIYDVRTCSSYKHPNMKTLNSYLKERIYAENFEFIYHLRNLHKCDSLDYFHIGINNMTQKVLTKKILSKKDFKEYLELIIFKQSEPFINSVADLY